VRLAFIGGGTVGEAIIAGALAREVSDAHSISVCEIVEGRRQHLSATYGVSVTDDPAKAASGADVVVLAVKPQEFAGAAKGLSGTFGAGQTVMSIMAGVRIETISKLLNHVAVVRAIPNTAAAVGESMTVWTATEGVAEESRKAVKLLLGVLGKELYVDSEKYVDMATAVSSSGPAYVFLVMEAMIDAAVHIGLRREVAIPMVIQTLAGSARYAEESGRHPAELRNQVTSPGGTTTEGLAVLEDAGVRAAFTQAIEAAYLKAQKLGG
jgi:pyrroline-5-carboxylate reductase